MKKILLIIGLAVAMLTGQAAQATSTLPAGTRTNIMINGACALTSFVVANTNAALAVNLTIIDNNATNQTYSITQYTNRVAYLTNIVTSWTDINGVANVMTNNALYYADNTVAAYSGSFSRVLTLTVPAATTYTYTPSTPLFFGRGILITNDSAVNLTATYSSVK